MLIGTMASASAETIVESRDINMSVSVTLPNGPGGLVTGTNCGFGIGWYYTKDGWEGTGNPPWPFHSNVEVTKVEVIFGGETINVPLAGRPTNPGSRIIKFQSNHFVHWSEPEIICKVTFVLDGVERVVQDNTQPRIYNRGLVLYDPNFRQELKDNVNGGSEDGPAFLDIGTFVGFNLSSEMKHETHYLLNGQEPPAVLSEYEGASAFYFMGHILNPQQIAVHLHGNTNIFENQFAGAKGPASPKMNLAVFDTCYAGRPVTEGWADTSANGSLLTAALQVTNGEAAFLVDRAACGWTIEASVVWATDFAVAFWLAIADGKTAFAARDLGLNAIGVGDDQSLESPPVDNPELNNIEEWRENHGSYRSAFEIVGDDFTTLNSLYNGSNNQEFNWYKIY